MPVWYNFDTVLCQFLEIGTSDRCLLGIVKNLRTSGFILYPLSFFLYSPFKYDVVFLFHCYLVLTVYLTCRIVDMVGKRILAQKREN